MEQKSKITKNTIILFIFCILITIFGCIEVNYVEKYMDHEYYNSTNSSDYYFYNKCNKIDFYVFMLSVIDITLVCALFFLGIQRYCPINPKYKSTRGPFCICIILNVVSLYFLIFTGLGFMILLIFPQVSCFPFWMKHTPELLVCAIIQFFLSSLVLMGICMYCINYNRQKKDNTINMQNHVSINV
jgi:hypothetical protein